MNQHVLGFETGGVLTSGNELLVEGGTAVLEVKLTWLIILMYPFSSLRCTLQFLQANFNWAGKKNILALSLQQSSPLIACSEIHT